MGGRAVKGGLGILAGAAFTAALPCAAETPSPLWSGVKRVGVVCLVNTDHGVDTGALRDRLCARVRALTTAGAPVPVVKSEIGDAAMLSADQLTLLVHASTGGTPGGRLMAISIRPYRGAASATLLFGAEPRVVSTNAADTALDAALSVPLGQLLPWRRDTVPRPIR